MIFKRTFCFIRRCFSENKVDDKDCEGLVLVGVVAQRLHQLKLDAAGSSLKSHRFCIFFLSTSFSEKMSTDY